jgi:hypothetical protein
MSSPLRSASPPPFITKDLALSVDSIANLQTKSGLVLWTPGGHADPWNHVETAIALDIGGRSEEARRAYQWLADNQADDGAWHQYYFEDSVKDAKFDANTIAYVASGAWHHYLCTEDVDWLSSYWPFVKKAIDWVLIMQQPTGEVFWAREPDGTPFHYALITGSSSIHHSLHSAIEIARRLGHACDAWINAKDLLRHALQEHPLEFFAEKDRWAMDWYYPILSGIHRGEEAARRIKERWSEFVIDGEGVRCVNDHPWVTTGETAEAAIACERAGLPDEARALLDTTAQLRSEDGSYWTGLHVPTRTYFPEGERTAYSAAAVILASAVLHHYEPTVTLFNVC